MGALREVANRVHSFFHKEQRDAELESELAAHLDLAVEENLRRGLSPEEARRQALIRFGGVEQAKEQQREARGLPKLDVFFQDLRYTFRTLGRDRAFTIVAVLILALAIGANIAVFSVVDTLLLRPLPFSNAQQLVWIAPPPSRCGLSCATYSADAFEEFRAQSHSYQDVTGYYAFSSADNHLLTGGREPLPVTGIDVIGNFFQVLGVQPSLGRLFKPEDARHGASPVALLANAYWRRQFSSNPAIVGKTIEMDGQQVTVIGVLPPDFDFASVFSPGSRVDLFTPVILDDVRPQGNIVTFIGRLKPGVSLAQAQAEGRLVAPRIYFSPLYPNTLGYYTNSIIPVPLKQYVSGKLRRSLIVLWCAVGGILLIACVNLSNLLLARAAARSKEFALRTALGASRARIVRQLLTESLVLSAGGALLGLLLAWTLVSWLAHQGAISLPLLGSLRIDATALAWTVFVAVLAAMLFGTIPGFRMARGNLQESLKDAGPGSGLGRKHERLRSVLVVSEVALACILLVGAGLLLRSFLRVLDVDLGFQPSRAASIKLDYKDSPQDGDGRAPASRLAIVSRRTAFYQRVIARIDALPGVEAAGISDYLPLGGNRSWGTPWPKGITPPATIPTGPLVYVITPGYLRAMGTAVRGRDFSWDDGFNSEPVVMIDASFARFLAGYAHWPNGDALGQILTRNNYDMRIVGIVDDVRTESLEGETGWQIYYPATQQYPTSAKLVVRTSLPPATLASGVLGALREINPNQPAAEFRPLQTLVDHAVSPRRFFMLLVTSFAALGLFLAALGIYGVIAYSVTQRTQEIGIRMALGASRAHVQLRVLANTLKLVLTGIGAGIVASLAVARGIAALLFGTATYDPLTFGAMVLTLGIVALLAGYLPARRASRIDPMVALRND
jgi:predicted permease